MIGQASSNMALVRQGQFHPVMPEPYDLLPTGSELREVLWAGSIPVAIIPSCQDRITIAL